MNALMFENPSPACSIAAVIARFCAVEQARRPGVRHVGQQLQSSVADGRDSRGGLIERVLQIRIGAEGKSHCFSLRSLAQGPPRITVQESLESGNG